MGSSAADNAFFPTLLGRTVAMRVMMLYCANHMILLAQWWCYIASAFLWVEGGWLYRVVCSCQRFFFFFFVLTKSAVCRDLKIIFSISVSCSRPCLCSSGGWTVFQEVGYCHWCHAQEQTWGLSSVNICLNVEWPFSLLVVTCTSLSSF